MNTDQTPCMGMIHVYNIDETGKPVLVEKIPIKDRLPFLNGSFEKPSVQKGEMKNG